MKNFTRIMFLANLIYGAFNLVTGEYILALMNLMLMLLIGLWWLTDTKKVLAADNPKELERDEH